MQRVSASVNMSFTRLDSFSILPTSTQSKVVFIAPAPHAGIHGGTYLQRIHLYVCKRRRYQFLLKRSRPTSLENPGREGGADHQAQVILCRHGNCTRYICPSPSTLGCTLHRGPRTLMDLLEKDPWGITSSPLQSRSLKSTGVPKQLERTQGMLIW
jgi:hypothetical protein